MDAQALIKTSILCLASIILEAISASKSGKKWFESLVQPKHSFPFWFWYIIGGLYYVMCAVVGYRQFHSNVAAVSLPVVLLIFMMLMNGLSNFVLFRYRSLRGFYLVLYPFAILLGVLMVIVWPSDHLSAILTAAYLVWLGYDLYYFYALLKANK